jgi:hypothetical protein
MRVECEAAVDDLASVEQGPMLVLILLCFLFLGDISAHNSFSAEWP